MIQPYAGEIRMFAGSFAPAGWMLCEGQLLPVSGNETLFGAVGNAYGGDGVDTFALPDLRGRLPLHQGSGFTMGQAGGTEEVALVEAELPPHTHALLATNEPATAAAAQGGLLAQPTSHAPYLSAPADAVLAPASVASAGAGQPHSNLQPYVCISFIISLFGTPPSST